MYWLALHRASDFSLALSYLLLHLAAHLHHLHHLHHLRILQLHHRGWQDKGPDPDYMETARLLNWWTHDFSQLKPMFACDFLAGWCCLNVPLLVAPAIHGTRNLIKPMCQKPVVQAPHDISTIVIRYIRSNKPVVRQQD